MASNQDAVALPELGKWRKRLLPVYPNEMKQFIAMSIMLFCILFSYTIVRTLKDTLLINAPGVDKKMILPLAKVLLVTPCSILFVILYAKMSNLFSKEKLFYYTMAPFVIFFFTYAFFVYPMHEYLQVSTATMAEWQSGFFSRIFGAWSPLPLFGYWSFSLFYVMAELFGNVGVGILFWQFANQVIPTDKAKRLYPIYGLWSNLGLIAAGLLGKWATKLTSASQIILPNGEKDFSSTLQLFCGFVTAAGLITLYAYYWINRQCLDGTENASGKKKDKKPKMSMGESLKFLMHSRYLGYITILVLAYGITINLVENSWKASVSDYFSGDKSGYNEFMSNLYIYTGISTMILIVCSKNLISLFGWRIAASITPVVSLITGGLFFAFVIFKDSMAGVCGIIGSTPAAVAMVLGLMQNVITKSAKYSLFDPTKEMAYIPLDEDSKVKGKAAIDVIGGRAGKSGGGIINMIVGKFFVGNGFNMIIGGLTVFLCMVWWWAVKNLSVDYAKKLKEKESA